MQLRSIDTKASAATVVALLSAACLVAACSTASTGPAGDGGADDATSCGAYGEPCCNGTTCNTGLTCAGTCSIEVADGGGRDD